MTKEIVIRRIFFEPSEQITDRDIEILMAHGWCVQQHERRVVGGFGNSGGLRRGHTLEHLELHSFGDTSLFGQQVGPGNIEQVVACQAKVHTGHSLGVQQPVEASFVIRICLDLRTVRGLRPAMHGGIDLLHG